MDIIYRDADIVAAVKPSGVLSTDEPGGMPELLRLELGVSELRTVHRLDRVVSGLMLLALNSESASELSRQIRDGEFHKEYLAVVHGEPPETGTLRDLMYRDKARKMSFVTDTPAKGVQEAILNFETLGRADGMSLVRIELVTGRTHQIRCQFAHHGWALVGERKYAVQDDPCKIALWSHRLRFTQPVTGEEMDIRLPPPEAWPWSLFKAKLDSPERGAVTK